MVDKSRLGALERDRVELAEVRERVRVLEERERVLEARLEKGVTEVLEDAGTSARPPNTAAAKKNGREPVRKFFTVKEVATQLSVSPKTVYSWINEGRLQAVDLGAQTKRIQAEDYARFLQEAEDR